MTGRPTVLKKHYTGYEGENSLSLRCVYLWNIITMHRCFHGLLSKVMKLQPTSTLQNHLPLFYLWLSSKIIRKEYIMMCEAPKPLVNSLKTTTTQICDNNRFYIYMHWNQLGEKSSSRVISRYLRFIASKNQKSVIRVLCRTFMSFPQRNWRTVRWSD